MLFFIFMFFVFFILSKLNYNKNRLDITVFFNVYWLFFILMGLANYHSMYNISVHSILWILLACIALTMGYDLGVTLKVNPSKQQFDQKYTVSVDKGISKEKIIRFMTICFMAVFVYKVLVLVSASRITGSLSLYDIFLASREIKYQNEPSSGIGRVFDFIYYPCAILFGKEIKSIHGVDRIKLIISFVLALFVTVMLDGAKAPIIFTLALFMVGFLGSSFCEGGYKLKKINIKVIIVGVLLFYFVMMFLMNRNVEDLKLYAFGEIPAFDRFYNSFNGKLTYGKQSFFGLIRNIDHSAIFNGNESNYALPEGINLMTNIYTAFRCSITDFGYIGGLVFYAVIGFVAGEIISVKRHGMVKEGILNWILGYIMLSFMISIGFYFTISLSMFLAPVYCFLIKRYRLKIR